MTAQLPTSRGKNRTITPTNMSDGQSHTSKEPSKGFLKAPKNWLKKTFSSRSTSPQPSADGQEIRGGESSSNQRASVSSGRQWIGPVIGTSAALGQEGIFMRRCPWIERSAQHADHRTPAQLSRSQPSSSESSLGLPGFQVAHGSRL